MAQHRFDHAPGTTTVSEAVRDWLKFENVDKFNEAYIEELARGMLTRWKLMKGATEAEITGVADARETGYRNNFVKFWKARDMVVDQHAADTAWRKTRAKAVQRYYQLRMQASAPPLPEPVPVGEGDASASAEKPLAIMEPSKWFHWDDVAFSREKFHQLAAEFVPELARALEEMSPDPAVRMFKTEQVKNLFQQKLFRMYMNQYPDRSPEELRVNVQGWLDARWDEVLEAARKFPLPK
jgi:hypothetical protein